MKLKQQYLDQLRKSLNNDKNNHWETRFEFCARSVLNAVCFREVTQNSYTKNKSVLLQPIGFYYSLFHMNMAILCLEHTVKLNELKQMKHARLLNLIKSKFVSTGVLNSRYLKLFSLLKRHREYTNYTVGGKNIDDPIRFKDFVGSLYRRTGKAFSMAISFIDTVRVEATEKKGYFELISKTIGDDIGGDVCKMYLSDEDEEKVSNYLMKKNLTT